MDQGNLQKYTFSNSGPLFLFPFFKPDRLGVEGAPGEMAGGGRLVQSQLFGPPGFVDGVEIVGQGDGGTAEFPPPGFGGGNALGLPLADVGALVLRHEGQDL